MRYSAGVPADGRAWRLDRPKERLQPNSDCAVNACMFLVVHVLLSGLPDLDPQFIARFQAREFSYRGGRYDAETFRYRLYVPRKLDHRYPLLLWLHGAGESGDDNERNLLWLEQLIPPPQWEKRGSPFFVLVAQCPGHNAPWYSVERPSISETDDARETDDMIDVVFAILNAIIAEYPIDRNRIYVSGVSSGGSGSWELAIRHPGLFAAVAPLGSGGSTNHDLKTLAGTPVWAFHSSIDCITPVQGARNTVYSLQKLGGNAHLTEIHSTDHDCWTDAFGKYGLMDWLLSQRRGGHPPGPPPGAVSLRWRIRNTLGIWQSGQVLLSAVTVAAIASCTALLFLRRRNRRAWGDAKVRELPSMDELISRH